MSASPPQGQESGLISARHQTSLSLDTHTHTSCQSHSDVRCDCNVLAPDVEPPPSTSGEEDVPPTESFSRCPTLIHLINVAPLKHTTLLKKSI